MNTSVPRTDVGSAPLLAALTYVVVVIFDPAKFDPNLLLGAIGLILPFLAGYLPTRLKSVYGASVGILTVVVVGLVEFLLTGTLGEGTKNVAITALGSAAFMFLIRPGMPDPELAPTPPGEPAARRSRG